MSVDEHAVHRTMSALWSPVIAITTRHGERVNGQIAVSGLSGSILPEQPRILVELWKANLTHDLVMASGVFALHFLPCATTEQLKRSLGIIRRLGFVSGKDHDKLDGVPWRSGATGSPILADALCYVEARVVRTLDGDEMTVFLADVVASGNMREGAPLEWHVARGEMPPEWLADYEANQQRQREAARSRRASV